MISKRSQGGQNIYVSEMIISPNKTRDLQCIERKKVLYIEKQSIVVISSLVL